MIYYKNSIIRDVDYAVDSEGRYQKVLSDGWTPKNDALEVTLNDIDERCQEILSDIKAGKVSPLAYHAEKNLMDISLLSDYTGFSKRTVRKHILPKYFARLEQKELQCYAEVLRITVEELTTIPE